uniref:Uncharacterized protein n=1 Tax=Nelumbo nucifera TaxID=4432 RepID=A0A822Y1Q9_NELNU|nr:TPA_asm: hypothetical protein HUJ06_026479 [Nelumbo nucifera]
MLPGRAYKEMEILWRGPWGATNRCSDFRSLAQTQVCLKFIPMIHPFIHNQYAGYGVFVEDSNGEKP